MKFKMSLFYFFLLGAYTTAIGQKHLVPIKSEDTLYISDIKTTHLLFGEHIEYVDIGSPYFVADTLKQMLRLKHTGEELLDIKSKLSNLTVITDSGGYYSFQLGYDRFATDLSFNVLDTQFLFPVFKKEAAEVEKETELEDLCRRLQLADKNLHITNKWGDDLFVVIRGIYYIEGKLGINIELTNQSPIDFEIDNMLFRTQMNKRFAADYLYQERVISPIRICGDSLMIPGNGQISITFLFDKFSVNKRESLSLDIVERNGGRYGTISIPRRKLLQPKVIAYEKTF